MRTPSLIFFLILFVSMKVGVDRVQLIGHRWVQVAFKPYGPSDKQLISYADRIELTFNPKGNFNRTVFSKGAKSSSSKGTWAFNYDQSKINFQVAGASNGSTDVEIIKLTTDSLILRHGSYYQKENKRSKVYVYDDSYFVRER